MTKHIGIVACSAEGASLCYRTICAEGAARLGGHAHPEVSIHTPSLAAYVACLEAGDLGGVADLMLASADKLAKIGADFLICPDNTIHAAMDRVHGRSPLPWLHIVDCVADAAEAAGYGLLGLTGTRWLVTSEVYPARLTPRGIGVLRPLPEDIALTDRLIMEELVPARATPQTSRQFAGVLGRLAGEGAEAVILGCTELPMAIEADAVPVPVLDSTRLLARAALDRALTEK